MRRHLPDFTPRHVPSDLIPESFGPVQFRVKDMIVSVPFFKLFDSPTIFRNYTSRRDSETFRNTLDTIGDTATSVKAFNVVFHPLLYGYLDIDEVERHSPHIRQDRLALIVDSLILADKLEAESITKLILKDLVEKYEGAWLPPRAIRKLLTARPATEEFLIRHIFCFDKIQERPRAAMKRHFDFMRRAVKEIDGLAEIVRNYIAGYEETEIASILVKVMEELKLDEESNEQVSVTGADQAEAYDTVAGSYSNEQMTNNQGAIENSVTNNKGAIKHTVTHKQGAFENAVRNNEGALENPVTNSQGTLEVPTTRDSVAPENTMTTVVSSGSGPHDTVLSLQIQLDQLNALSTKVLADSRVRLSAVEASRSQARTVQEQQASTAIPANNPDKLRKDDKTRTRSRTILTRGKKRAASDPIPPDQTLAGTRSTSADGIVNPKRACKVRFSTAVPASPETASSTAIPEAASDEDGISSTSTRAENVSNTAKVSSKPISPPSVKLTLKTRSQTAALSSESVIPSDSTGGSSSAPNINPIARAPTLDSTVPTPEPEPKGKGKGKSKAKKSAKSKAALLPTATEEEPPAEAAASAEPDLAAVQQAPPIVDPAPPVANSISNPSVRSSRPARLAKKVDRYPH